MSTPDLPGPPDPTASPSPYVAPPGYYGASQTSTKAIVALCLAVSAYTPIVPFIGAIVALFVASSARRDIMRSGGAQTGLGLCTAATVLSIVHLVLVTLAVVLVFGVFAVPFFLN